MKDELDYSIHRVSNSMKKKKYDEDDGWKKIKKRTLDRPKFRMPRTWINSAACLAVVLGGILFIHEKLKQERTVVLVQNETSRQADTARVELMLANGKSVDLRHVNHLHEEELGIDIVRDSTNDQLTFRTREEASDEIRYNRLMVPKGSDFTFRLPDGSLVTINSESVLSFPVQFPTDSRVVYLEGEAYFEVAKDVERPFTVCVEGVNVTALGTEFNISSVGGDGEVFTTLVNGSVRVKNEQGKECILQPSQQAVCRRGDEEIGVQEVNTALYTSWKDGYYMFDKQPLEKIRETLARWYDVKVFFADPQVAGIRFSGRVKRYEDIYSVLEMIRLTNDVAFEIDGQNVTVSYKEKRK